MLLIPAVEDALDAVVGSQSEAGCVADVHIAAVWRFVGDEPRLAGSRGNLVQDSLDGIALAYPELDHVVSGVRGNGRWTALPIAPNNVVIGAIWVETATPMPLGARVIAALTRIAASLERPLATNAIETRSVNIERTVLLRTIECHKWNLSRAAEDMGISRTKLYELLKEFSLTRPPRPSRRPSLQKV